MKKILLGCLFLTTVITNSGQATESAVSSVFEVNPDTIRTQLLSQNISLLESLNNVEASKLNVNMARAKLFPSLNLGALLPALVNPTFLLSSVNFLLPFLIPSNWAVLKEEKNLFEADKASYKTLELNLLSSAYALFYTHINDQEIQNIYNEQSIVLEKIYLNLKHQSEVLGNVAIEDLQMSLAQFNDAKVKTSQFKELIIEEKANLRTLLALPLGSELSIVNREIPSSAYEDKNVFEVFDRSMKVAPEVIQLDYLVKAAQNEKFSKMMGFISQASLGGVANNSGSAFGNLKVGGTFTFGLDNVVSVQIAGNNIDSIKLLQKQLQEENEKISEVLIGQLNEMKSQILFSADALKSRQAVFEGQKGQYALGLISLQTLLQTESQLTDSKINFAKSVFDNNLQRLAFLRLVVDGDFAKVDGCSETSSHRTLKRSHHFLGFGKKQTGLSLDEVCRQ